MTTTWLALLAPWPEDARPVRTPVATAADDGGDLSSIAGWTQLVVERTAAPDGHRVTQVVLDADGRPISASDWVMRRAERGDVVELRHESLGGRIEPDGSFRGTRWRGVTTEDADGEALAEEMLPSSPAAGESEALLALVRELMRRAG